MKDFKLKPLQSCLFVLMIMIGALTTVNAAEWKSEPSVYFKTQYNDNVRMRTEASNPEGSTGYTLEPRIKFAGKELGIWDVSADARGRVTRYPDVTNADSENLFFVFSGERQTERTNWRLNANYSDNTNFDNNFTTENPDTGLFDEQTRRKVITVTPSVSWSVSEVFRVNFSLNKSIAKYEEASNARLVDSDTSNANLGLSWSVSENHNFGFNTSYVESNSPDVGFSYDQAIVEMSYNYIINPTSNFGFSFGGRRLNSLSKNVTVACDAAGTLLPPVNGSCPDSFLGIPLIPVTEDLESTDDGIVTSLSYTSKTERTTHIYNSGRSVLPSSLGGAQEILSASYQFRIKNTERWTTKLILGVSNSKTISGVDGSSFNDRTRYRFEPSIEYRLNKNWKLSFDYRYLNIKREDTGEESISNAVFINLFLHWPRLVTTY